VAEDLYLSSMTGIAPRRNQHALRAVSRRTPTPVLLPLLRACSFRLVNDAFAPRFRWDLARSLRYFLRLLSPSFGIASSPVANSQPKRHQEIDGQAEGSNRRIRSKGVASLANEVRRAMMCRSRDAQASSHNNDSLLVPQQCSEALIGAGMVRCLSVPRRRMNTERSRHTTLV